MRAYPNLHPLVARHLGTRLMYAPPYRHVPHTLIRLLVVPLHSPFRRGMLYCSDLRRGLRRRFIMEIAQALTGLTLIITFSLLMGKLIDDLR